MPRAKWFDKNHNRISCSIEKCQQPVLIRGWCRKHYKRWLAHGDPNTILRGEIGKWHLHTGGYNAMKIKGKLILQHRYIMEHYLGKKLKSNEVVHHIDENRLNNCIENLEVMIRNQHIGIHHTTTFRDKTHKQCTYCKVIKPRWMFDFESKKKRKSKFFDPHHTRCKSCRYLNDKRNQNRPGNFNFIKTHCKINHPSRKIS